MAVVTTGKRATSTSCGAADPGADPGGRRPVRLRHSLVSREVLRFVAGAMLAAIAVGIATFIVIGHDAEAQAIRVAENITQVEGHSVVEPAITEPLLNRSQVAIASFDSLVRQRLLSSAVVRVKLWNADGVIVYSDEHRLVGRRFPFGAEERAALHGGAPASSVSNLSDPENLYERSFGKLLQVYLPLASPSGAPMLFETYQRYEAISMYQGTVWSSFVPVLGGGLLLLFVITVPLAYSLARRLRTSLSDREALLQRAITSSERERARIARDLHDGVVQNLAAVTYSLSAASRRMRAGSADATVTGSAANVAGATATDSAQIIAEAADTTRRAMTDLRTLIVEIAPPNLVAEGLDNALRDLLDPMAARGVDTSLDTPPELSVSAEHTTVLFRVAQEALRNAGTHAEASAVAVRVRQLAATVSLEVDDDGRGFSDADLDQRRSQGHVGLSLLRDLVADARGTLTVTSRPGRGTHVAVEIPRA